MKIRVIASPVRYRSSHGKKLSCHQLHEFSRIEFYKVSK